MLIHLKVHSLRITASAGNDRQTPLGQGKCKNLKLFRAKIWKKVNKFANPRTKTSLVCLVETKSLSRFCIDLFSQGHPVWD